MPSYFDIIPDKFNERDGAHNRPESGWRRKLYEVIFEAHTPAGKFFDVCLFVLILTNLIVLVMESVPHVRERYQSVFYTLDYFYLIAFSLEYILRLICVRSKRRYILSFYGIIDLLAIIPSYLEIFFPHTHMLMIIRSFRLLRVFRIFRMVKFLDESRLLVFALLKSTRKIIIFLFFVLLLTIFMGTLMYFLEYDHNSGFSNIPQSIYWAIVTITTVGYGDIAPVTASGKLLASFIMILGYAIIAVPTGIVSSQMVRENAAGNVKMTEVLCKHCGKGKHAADARYCNHCGNLIED